MDAEARAQLEARIRTPFEAGDLQQAATVALEGYGPELFGTAMALLRDPGQAEEVFAEFTLDLWTGLARFQWRSSFRTWAYAVLHNALRELRASPDQDGRRRLSLSRSPEVANLEVLARSITRPYLRTEVKSQVSQLRAALDPDDQLLLILRLDKGLSWNEIAEVTGVEAVALRKRFQRVKDQLREVAVREGILAPDEA